VQAVSEYYRSRPPACPRPNRTSAPTTFPEFYSPPGLVTFGTRACSAVPAVFRLRRGLVSRGLSRAARGVPAGVPPRAARPIERGRTGPGR